MDSGPVTIEYRAEWRLSLWDADVPSRPAWLVSCPEHPQVGKTRDGEPWGYAARGQARAVATRHSRRFHHG